MNLRLPFTRTTPTLFVALALVLGLGIGLLPLPQLALVVAVCVALATLCLVFVQPVFAIALMVVVAPFTPYVEININSQLDVGQLAFGLVIAAYLVRMLTYKKDIVPQKLGVAWLRQYPLSLPMLLFIAVALLSFFKARSFADWASECAKWLEMLALYLIVAHQRDPRKRRILIAAILFSAAYQGIAGAYQYLRGFGPAVFLIPGTKLYRSYGSFEQPNPFGGYVGLAWLFCAGASLGLWRNAFAQKPRPNLISLFFAVLTTLITAVTLSGVFTSGSRGAQLGAVGAVAVMALAWVRPRLGWVLLGLGTAFGLAWLLGLPATIYDRFSTFLVQYQNLDMRGIYLPNYTFSNVERLAHWQAALNMMRDQFWLGVGFGNYEPAYAQYRLLYWENALGHAHNYYLNVFAETGVFGFAAYLFFWGCVFVRTWRKTFPTHHSPFFIHHFLSVGLLGVWAHLTLHHAVDNLYVANTYLLIGVLLGVLEWDVTVPHE